MNKTKTFRKTCRQTLRRTGRKTVRRTCRKTVRRTCRKIVKGGAPQILDTLEDFEDSLKGSYSRWIIIDTIGNTNKEYKSKWQLSEADKKEIRSAFRIPGYTVQAM